MPPPPPVQNSPFIDIRAIDPDHVHHHPKCLKYLYALHGASIDPTLTGTRSNSYHHNLLLCELKASKVRQRTCQEKFVLYMGCYTSVMSVGSYNGRRDCGEEMRRLHECLYFTLPFEKK